MFKQENLKFLENKNNLNISYLSLLKKYLFKQLHFIKEKN